MCKGIKKFELDIGEKIENNKIIGLESNLFVNGSIYPALFGKIKGVYFSGNKKEDFDFNSVDSDSKIHFNSNTNEYTFLVPITKKTTNKLTKNKIISLDPGIRKFMTDTSENEAIKVGKEVN
jgi:transposase